MPHQRESVDLPPKPPIDDIYNIAITPGMIKIVDTKKIFQCRSRDKNVDNPISTLPITMTTDLSNGLKAPIISAIMPNTYMACSQLTFSFMRK